MQDIRTNEDFDRFLEEAGKLKDENVQEEPKRINPNLLLVVLNDRYD